MQNASVMILLVCVYMKHCCTLDVAVCFPAWIKHVAPPDSHNASCLPPLWQQRYCSPALLVTRWSPAVLQQCCMRWNITVHRDDPSAAQQPSTGDCRRLWSVYVRGGGLGHFLALRLRWALLSTYTQGDRSHALQHWSVSLCFSVLFQARRHHVPEHAALRF